VEKIDIVISAFSDKKHTLYTITNKDKRIYIDSNILKKSVNKFALSMFTLNLDIIASKRDNRLIIAVI
jgi:hypothetical protein